MLSWSQKRYLWFKNLRFQRCKLNEDVELHGWNPAPYNTKAEVDASYSRLINIGLSKENKDCLVIGVASHNLFHIAFAQQLAELREVTSMVEIEMLEGMANAEAMAVKQKFGSVLLYSPITLRKDFPAAVAYLVRRLDNFENYEHLLEIYLTRQLDSVHVSFGLVGSGRKRVYYR